MDRTRGVGLLPLLRLVDTWPAIVSFTPVARFSFISSRLLRGRVSSPLSSSPIIVSSPGYINGNTIDVDGNAGCESLAANLLRKRKEEEGGEKKKKEYGKEGNLNTAAGFTSGSLTKRPIPVWSNHFFPKPCIHHALRNLRYLRKSSKRECIVLKRTMLSERKE